MTYVRDIFKDVNDGVIIYGLINGTAGCMYRYRSDSFIVCTNRYSGGDGDTSINRSTGFSGAVSVSGTFSGFIPSEQQKQNSIKTIIIEFDTFVSVNQNF